MNGFFTVNALACLLVATAVLVTLTKTPRKAAYLYSVQSLVLIGIFVTLGNTVGSTELFSWAGTAFVTKVVLVPAIILFALKKMGEPAEKLDPVVSPAAIVVLSAVEILACAVAVGGITLPAAAMVKPALAISLAHFFIGLTCIVTQRNILKQVFGYCLMENGSHLTLALLAPTAPSLVEIGIATDAVFAIIIMAVMVTRIYRVTRSLDADGLMELKG